MASAIGMALIGPLLNVGTAVGLSATAAVNFAFAGAKFLGAAVVRLAVGAVIAGATARAIAGKFGTGSRPQADLKRDLRFASSRPPYRFAYGWDRIPGTEIPSPVTGEWFWCAYLLNSRPSSLTEFTVYVDNREVEWTGDPFDFAGNGAAASNAPFAGHLWFWISRGDETGPPDEFLSQAGWTEGGDELRWKATDGAQGCTIIWCKMAAGPSESRYQRWPNPIPQVDIDGDWSFVWDPTDPAQDLEEPATWTFSSNAARCTLDTLTQNPFRPHTTDYLLMETWDAAVTLSDELRDLVDDTALPLYQVGGLVVFSGGELEDIVNPLIAAQGARLFRAGGMLGIIPQVAKVPVMSIDESLGGMGHSSFGGDVVTELRVTYASDDRGGQPAELIPWDVPGAPTTETGAPNVSTLDLAYCPNAYQAMWIRKPAGLLGLDQRRHQTVALPEALQLLPGSWVTLDYPEPFGAAFNGTYEVESSHPTFDMLGEDGFAMRVPLTLAGTAASYFDWDEDTEEEAVREYSFSYARQQVQPPGIITAVTGPSVDLDTGGTVIPRIRFEFDPSASSGVINYVWEIRSYDVGNDPEDDWQGGGNISPTSLDGDGDVYAFAQSGIDTTKEYDIRVRTVTPVGASEWRVAPQIGFGFSLSAVTPSSTTAGEADFSFTTPDVSNLASVRVWYAPQGAAFGTATAYTPDFTVSRATGEAITLTGLAADDTDFWLAPVTTTGGLGAVSGPHTLTIT